MISNSLVSLNSMGEGELCSKENYIPPYMFWSILDHLQRSHHLLHTKIIKFQITSIVTFHMLILYSVPNPYCKSLAITISWHC
jgi:hypothetical protein